MKMFFSAINCCIFCQVQFSAFCRFFVEGFDDIVTLLPFFLALQELLRVLEVLVVLGGELDELRFVVLAQALAFAVVGGHDHRGQGQNEKLTIHCAGSSRVVRNAKLK